jgi:hypothetical protein
MWIKYWYALRMDDLAILLARKLTNIRRLHNEYTYASLEDELLQSEVSFRETYKMLLAIGLANGKRAMVERYKELVTPFIDVGLTTTVDYEKREASYM